MVPDCLVSSCIQARKYQAPQDISTGPFDYIGSHQSTKREVEQIQIGKIAALNPLGFTNKHFARTSLEKMLLICLSGFFGT